MLTVVFIVKLCMRNLQGFTLLEVLIALAIISIALTAIIKASSQNIKDTAYLEDKAIANWVGLEVMNEVKAETGVKGKDLFHPVRIVLTGAHSGPEFDKLIPLFEDGSRLSLPAHVLSVRERVEAFL